MRKILTVLCLLVFASTTASAWYPPPVVVVPPPPTGTAFGAGAAATTGFLGFVGFLVLYDLWRRNNCAGDVLRLGGPGFSTPSNPYQNVMLTVADRGLCARPRAIRVRG